jgi:aminodeoxyfutalosine deaminase
MEVHDFIAGLPKAELHVHLVGSASVPTVLELAQRHPDRGVPTDEEALRAFYEFTDFAHFIEVYVAVNSLVRTDSDVEALILGVAADLAAQQVRYAELTVTPDSHLLEGIEPDAVADAMTRARGRAAREHGIELAWIFDIPGELGLESGLRTIDWVERWAPEGSVGFGLGGPELGVPRPQFAGIFRRAEAIGLHSVPHAGETTGPQTIWDSLHVLRAERIGHGVSAVHDPELVTYLADNQITLEMCPTSNIRTRAVRSLAEHPMPALLAAGVPVCLNTDDPGMFNTTLNTEYAVAHEAFGIDPAGLAELARTGVRASYAGDATKQRILAGIDAHTAGLGQPAAPSSAAIQRRR